MARAHDGLMMLLMVGRNRALSLVVFYDGWLSLMIIVIFFMLDGCIMYVMVPFTRLYLYHERNKVDVSLSFAYVCSSKSLIPVIMYNG